MNEDLVVDEWDDDKIRASEDNVGAITNVVEDDWSYKDDTVAKSAV